MRIFFFLISGIFLLGLGQKVQAQKKDHIILYDSIFREGKIEKFPSNGLTEVSFRRSSREEFQTYTIDQITEFQYNGRKFSPKEIAVSGTVKTVFLEKLPNPVQGAIIWKLNTQPAAYLLETSEGFEYLGENFREVLLEKFGKSDLKPLLDITSLEDIHLAYLNKTANTLETPRTFTRHLVFTPYLGMSSQRVGFSLPDADLDDRIGGFAPVVGISGELFLDFERRFSVSTGVLWSRFDSQEFFKYSRGSTRFETDVYMDFALIQIPISARYYYDFKPNEMRFFAELGYVYGLADFKNTGVFQAELIGTQEIISTRRPFELEREFAGMMFGIGVEKYLSTYRGVTLGLRNSSLGGRNDSSIQSLTFYIGYKF